MKKLFTYFLMATLAVTMLTSCEPEDEQIARTLEGDWSGTMEDYYYNRWGSLLSGGNYKTYFRFLRSSPTSGTGIEIDEDRFGNYVEREFSWRVEYQYSSSRYSYYDDGFFTVYLNYDSWYYYEDRWGNGGERRGDYYQAVIYNAYLSGSYFEGEMEDSDGVRKRFKLNNQSYNWRWRTSTRASVESGNNEK